MQWRWKKLSETLKIQNQEKDLRKKHLLSATITMPPNSLPVNIKSAETFEVLEKLIKTWDREMCRCRMCIYNILAFKAIIFLNQTLRWQLVLEYAKSTLKISLLAFI